ncbi:DNA polymerase III subunit epsilon [Coxiella burnetii]|nr:DNA polymerase III, epsilon subunit [Coxiella burnetii RSA 331]AML49695.1 DNA polymerase III subunit epsilon [Coxiella burnetii]ATN85629.1 DNA polymerase III subunit epsilon [Coxiella burnetii str. Schperling]EAX32373.1 DNA polymerase III subunit epsilon [Coxiella burnetii 'MSU Goat Q177']EDR35385.1 DNA polymerase III, epsilon subunit [Coxiella burnetii Q321]
MRQIVLDTETTGLVPEEGHRIIEIGALEMVNRRLTGNHLHFYINPERSIERDAIEIHGITDSFLIDKPLFKDIATELISFLKGAELIIHNAPFDVGFLNHELKLTGQSFKTLTHYCQVLDTLTIARQKHPGQHNNLDALCRRYHVDNSNRDYHGALLDAELLAQVYLLMTGGQTVLFEQQGFAVASRSVSVRPLGTDRDSLSVIRANAAETEAHRAFLQLLTENGLCLWNDQ